MKIRLIRHATMVVELGGVRLLVDPVFSPAGVMPPIDNSPNSRPNPLVDLPVIDSELCSVDAVLLTHTHRDHFDAVAAGKLPKTLPVFCQPQDEQKLKDLGFGNVMAVTESIDWRQLGITRTGGEHGTGDIGQKMGPVSGYVLKWPGEPILYIAGDTIWCSPVEKTLKEHKPGVVVLFAGAARFLVGDAITMAAEDVAAVCRTVPAAKVVAVHMETFNHCLLTRKDLRSAMAAQGLAAQVLIPADGEELVF
jgi:L-ascorbate metabolism protein UlaG (beta-lactamase superfamily)